MATARVASMAANRSIFFFFFLETHNVSAVNVLMIVVVLGFIVEGLSETCDSW